MGSESWLMPCSPLLWLDYAFACAKHNSTAAASGAGRSFCRFCIRARSLTRSRRTLSATGECRRCRGNQMALRGFSRADLFHALPFFFVCLGLWGCIPQTRKCACALSDFTPNHFLTHILASAFCCRNQQKGTPSC